MTSTRSRLIVLKGALPFDPDELESLRAIFDVVEADDIDAARSLMRDAPAGAILYPLARLPDLGDLPPTGAASVLQHIGEGIGVVNAGGELLWASSMLRNQPASIREQFVEIGRQSVEWFGRRAETGDDRQPRETFEFTIDQSWFEVLFSPMPTAPDDGAATPAAVGVLFDVTASRRLQSRLDAIDAAGSELMKIEAGQITGMNMAQRLKWLEDKIARYVHELLSFDNFEIRLLNKETKQLELVIACGLTPLKIGEVIYAEEEGNGISGYVAATGESYICPDVRNDPRYREGLDSARSSLTVPLFLHDQVIGVFNAESYATNVFDETDRRFAEIFGRYIAIAMNILDLMVVERYTTNEQVAKNLLTELDEPLEEISSETKALLDRRDLPEEIRAGLDRISDASAGVRSRLDAVARGPKTIIGAEQELRRHEIDPLMQDKRVLVADDEPRIRETICSILEQKGCEVTVCENGLETIEALERSADARGYDLVISDIKMPDRNGYEVFRAAKKIDATMPVILMTGFGYDPHHSIVRSSQEGLDSFLFKPFKATQLLEAVTKSLNEARA